ncbi:DUF748 domain-containing protein [Thermodesulfobacteriota bacterium]
MASITRYLKRVKWYQWILSALFFTYLIYIALSYLYLPGKLKSITATDVSALIGRDISVEKYEFNPFILSLKINRLSIPDKPDNPLASWDQLLINISFWKSLFSWGIVLDELKLDSPEVNIIKHKTGFNFSDIIDRLSNPQPQNDTSSTEPADNASIALEIFNTSINKGAVRYSDLSGKIPAQLTLHEITIVIKELYIATGDKHLNPFNFNANIPGGGQLLLNGNYRIDPLHVESDINASGINLTTFSGFLENIVPVKINKGKLFFSTTILAKMEKELHMNLDKGKLSVNELLLDDDVPDPSMLTANDISVNELSMDLIDKKITIENVIFDSITTNQWIDEQGNIRYEKLIPEQSTDNTSEIRGTSVNNKEADAPWDILIKQVSLKNSTVNLEDRNENIIQGHSLSGINFDIRDFTLTPDSKTLIQLGAVLDEKGKISVDGSIVLSPLTMDLNYKLEEIMLRPFSEYLEATSYLKLETGELSVDGDLSISGKATTSINAAAALGLNDFEMKDTRSDTTVLSFKALSLDDIKAEVDKKSVSVTSVNLLKPELFLEMSEHKEINLSNLFKAQKSETKTTSPPEKTEDSNAWVFRVDEIRFEEGTAYYSDKSVKPLYKTGLYNMAFTINGIGSDMKSTAPFSFKTDIDKYAPFTIKGNLDPLDRQPGFEFTSMLKGLEMPHLSPYSAKFIGNNLKSGKLDLKLDYSLHGRKLKGNNNIVAKNLYLGEKVPVKPVINAPVGLGLALMRDISGVIDLDLGISGDLDDPGFSVSGIIIKTIVNIFVKAAASPFKLLGALIPGGNKDLGEIVFDPGVSKLNPENKDRLDKLAAALEKRPQLALNIKGTASAGEDIEALKIANLNKIVAEKRGIELTVLETELAVQKLWMINENFTALEEINNELGLLSNPERLEKIKSANPESQEPELQAMIAEQIFNDVLASLEIKEDKLLFLADQRALSIKQYLVDELKLGHERVSVIKTGSSDLSGRIIKLSLDAM